MKLPTSKGEAWIGQSHSHSTSGAFLMQPKSKTNRTDPNQQRKDIYETGFYLS
jgi:hypothetical protein